MNGKPVITAYFTEARIDNNRLCGKIWGDWEGRFGDGEFVTSSPIVDQKDDFVHTKNSFYRVISWQDPEQVPQFTREEVLRLKLLAARGSK